MPPWSGTRSSRPWSCWPARSLLAGVVGPILGTLLILVTGAPFPLANIVAGVTYAVLMPYVGLTMAYLYFDARVRSELATRRSASAACCPPRSSADTP